MNGTAGSASRGIIEALLVLPLAAVLALMAPALALAGGVGKWTNVSGPTGSILTQPDVAVRPDGSLGVLWIRDTPSAVTQDIMFRTIAPSGGNGPLQTVETGWGTLNNPAYLVSADLTQENAFFGGIRSTSPDDTHDGLNASASTFASPGWTLAPDVIDNQTTGSNAYGSDVEAIATTGGIFFTWYGTSGVWVHAGASSATPNFDHNAGVGNYGYYSNFGFDATANELWLVWSSNANDHPGMWTSLVDQATGAPTGTRYQLPKSASTYGGLPQFDMMMEKAPVTGRAGRAGVYVVYPTGYPTPKTLRLWKLSATAAGRRAMVVAGGSQEKQRVAVAAGPDGRLWVVWSENDGSRTRLFVRRSNAAVTSFGPTASLRTPAGYSSVWALAAAVRNGKLDVLAHASGPKEPAILHVQFKAPK